MGYIDDVFTSKPLKGVKDLSDHVDGGQASAAGTNVNADSDAVMVTRVAGAIVGVALALLWLLGGVVLKGVSV